MKISELTLGYIKDYCGISDTDSDAIIPAMQKAALDYIVGYTGLTAETVDLNETLTIAYLVLVNEMYSTRTMTVANDKENPCVKQILAMYSNNYL
jgi:hypothetical protein